MLVACAALVGLGHIYFHLAIHNLLGSFGGKDDRTRSFSIFALGMSLAAMGERDKACQTFGELAFFGDASGLPLTPGSRLATEHMDAKALTGDWADRLTARSRRSGSTIDLTALFYTGERTGARDHLTAAGWQTTVRTTTEAFAANGFAPPPAELVSLSGDSGYLTATLGGQPR